VIPIYGVLEVVWDELRAKGGEQKWFPHGLGWLESPLWSCKPGLSFQNKPYCMETDKGVPKKQRGLSPSVMA